MLVTALLGLLAGCRRSEAPETGDDGLPPGPPVVLDRTCDLAPYPSVQWTLCETTNFARITQAPEEHLANPQFQARALAQTLHNLQEWTERALRDPSWLDLRSGNTIATPVTATWEGPFSGDPYRYPQAPGPDGEQFYANEADVVPVVFYDRDCARLSGRVWAPKGRRGRLPAVVFIPGSVQASEPLYWPAAQALVRAGYVVLSFDARGQGRSDFMAPGLKLGSNLNLAVFWEGGVDAIDFLHSTPARPYPHEQRCAGTYPTTTAVFNPLWERTDPARLGVSGQSAGAIATSVIQGYGAPGADPWPGLMDRENPVDVVVGWDSMIGPGGVGGTPDDNGLLPAEVATLLTNLIAAGRLPNYGVRVPAMSHNADYSLIYPVPFLAPPDAERHKLALSYWQAAGLPAYGVTIAGTYHLDQGMAPYVPATSNCPDTSTGACRGGWALPSLLYYTVAWFDRWLKQPGEAGYADADARLLDDGGSEGAVKMSWHFHSLRDFPDRRGRRQHCEDIRAGC